MIIKLINSNDNNALPLLVRAEIFDLLLSAVNGDNHGCGIFWNNRGEIFAAVEFNAEMNIVTYLISIANLPLMGSLPYGEAIKFFAPPSIVDADNRKE